MRGRRLVLLLLLAAPSAVADHLVFGSFRLVENANNWAQKLAVTFGGGIHVRRVQGESGTWYRVQTEDLDVNAYALLASRADQAGVQHWRLGMQPIPGVQTPTDPGSTVRIDVPRQTPPSRPVEQQADRAAASGSIAAATGAGSAEWEWDLGLQSRLYSRSGSAGQDQYEGSVSAEVTYYRTWNDDQRSLTVTPFLRVDSADRERTHADMRELFVTWVGSNWDLHAGAKRVFWGVTEFHHLVDIINQTDLVENIDTEDKLGQPMVQLSLVRPWGILDLYALTGFRERTYPGVDGRLRLPLEIDDDPTYASGARRRRVDGAIRWSHHAGPFAFGVHHFSGTSRDPLLLPVQTGSGDILLRPHYPVIDQTGVDGQAFYGDWAFKFEGFSRSGYGERYFAFNAGFERTLVGVLGTRSDLGIVAEFMFDERQDEAFNTIFEHDLALGGRLALNDFADTQALFGVIVDTEYDDYIVSLEASRRLADTWTVSLEGRVFAGGKHGRDTSVMQTMFDPEYKTAWLQRDDYVQLEFTKFL